MTTNSKKGEGQTSLQEADTDADAYRLAEKYHEKHVYQAMEAQFKEIGMTSVVFVSYFWQDGKIVIDA